MPVEPLHREGKQWPLKMSYQKVERNIRDFQKEKNFVRNPVGYDGKKFKNTNP